MHKKLQNGVVVQMELERNLNIKSLMLGCAMHAVCVGFPFLILDYAKVTKKRKIEALASIARNDHSRSNSNGIKLSPKLSYSPEVQRYND